MSYNLESQEEVIVLELQFLVHDLLASRNEGTEWQDCLRIFC